MATNDESYQEGQADDYLCKNTTLIIQRTNLKHLDNKIYEVEAVDSAGKESVNENFVIFQSYSSRKTNYSQKDSKDTCI